MYGLQIKVPNRNQHRNNKANDFYEANSAYSVGTLRKIKNILEYRSDSFRNILNLSKLNKDLNSIPTPRHSQKTT